MSRALSIMLAAFMIFTMACQDSEQKESTTEDCISETVAYNDNLFHPSQYVDQIYNPPSATRYDESAFKARVVKLLMAGYGKEYSDEFQFGYYDFRKRKYPILRGYSHLCADTDFVFLTYYPWGAERSGCSMKPYHWDTGGPKQHFYVAYVKSTDKVYLLSDGFGPTKEDIFRRMHSESDGRPRLDLLYKAAFLIRLKYDWGQQLAVVYNRDDLDAWTNRWLVDIKSLCVEWTERNSLFAFNPSTNPDYMHCIDRLPSEIRQESVFPKDREILPPDIAENGDSTIVTLTTQCVEPLANEHVVTWQVGFDESDSLLFIRLMGEPFESY